MVSSLKLNEKWDIFADEYGNLVTVEGKRRVAQDVATACRLFTGEAIFHVDRGIPYLKEILGLKPQGVIIKAHLRRMALSVPNVRDAQVTLDRVREREQRGEILITDDLAYTDPEYAPRGPVDDFYLVQDVYGLPNVYKVKI